MRLSPLAILPVLIFASIAGMFAWGMFREDPNNLPLAIQGQTVPEVNLQTMPGKTPFTSADLKTGQVKLVNFWASWCGPCRVEHPTLMAMAEEGVPIYGINFKDDPADAAAFIAELGDPYTALAADPRGRNGLDWGVIAMPETFVVDGDGTILLRHAGPVTSSILRDVIRPFLDSGAPSG